MEKILQKNKVKELLIVEYQENGSLRALRKYKDKPERFSDEREVIITVKIDDTTYQKPFNGLAGGYLPPTLPGVICPFPRQFWPIAMSF